jgi:galactose mutarotase-like enzyme
VVFGFFSRPAPKRFPGADEFGFIELRGGDSRVVVVPALGGKISSMELAGRQWLWTSPVIPYAPPEEGASYVETADTGGYDECFPTVGACKLPTWIRGFGGLELPDHGELWSQPPEVDVRASAEGQAVHLAWTGKRMPYRFEREVRITPQGVVEMRYAATNTGAEKMPFIWSSHPLFPLGPRTRLHLPADTRVKVYAQHGIEIAEYGSDMGRWPDLRVSGKPVNFSIPDRVARRYACKLFFDMTEGWAALIEDDLWLKVEFDQRQVPNLGLWLNKEGWSPFRREKPYRNLAFEPCIGAPDTLHDALGAWNRAHWLEPGQTRRWSLRWSAKRVVPE